MSGLPPYGPGDLIDVEVDEDDHIWITMADHFSRPLRLSRQEALAITLRSAELLATPGLPEAPALASAVRKLREAFGPDTAGNDETHRHRGGRAVPPSTWTTLRRAARDHERITIEYFAGSTGEWSTRDVEPEEVFSAMGNWYVAAWDVGADDERLFRADRIRACRRHGHAVRATRAARVRAARCTPRRVTRCRCDCCCARRRDGSPSTTSTEDPRRARRRIARGHAADGATRLGRRRCCSASVPTPRCCSRPRRSRPWRISLDGPSLAIAESRHAAPNGGPCRGAAVVDGPSWVAPILAPSSQGSREQGR